MDQSNGKYLSDDEPIPASIANDYVECQSMIQSESISRAFTHLLHFTSQELEFWENELVKPLRASYVQVVKFVEQDMDVLFVVRADKSLYLVHVPKVLDEQLLDYFYTMDIPTYRVLEREYKTQLAFSAHKLAPKPIAFKDDMLETRFSFLVSSYVPLFTLAQLLQETLNADQYAFLFNKLLSLLQDLKQSNLFYGMRIDTLIVNTSVLSSFDTLHFTLFDFRYASTKHSHPEMECLSLLDSIESVLVNRESNVRVHIYKPLVDFYIKTFGNPEPGLSWRKQFFTLLHAHTERNP